ncbi:hypothetical protein [Paenibacillus sp. SI8]|uniref:LiaF transmembrane domain-containing protein n=1 Tax=unclassified Paenibacillus TaxID=185978 RepID=UPI003465F25A
MNMNGTRGLALLLIAAGFIICVSKLGFHLHVMGILFPLAMVGLGYVGIKNGKKIGWLIGGVGALVLMGKLSGLIAFVFAVALIAYGVHLLRKRTNSPGSEF